MWLSIKRTRLKGTTKDIFNAKVGVLGQVDFKNIKESLKSFLQQNSIKTIISRPIGQVQGDESNMVQNLTPFSKYK